MTCIMLPLLVRTRFQVLFHSPPGVLFAFPSRYWFTIGRRVVFSLGGWSPPSSDRIPRVPPYSLSSPVPLRVRESHPLRFTFPRDSAKTQLTFGLLPVRSPLLGKSRLISFPRGTEMFHFPRFASCLAA